MRGSASDPGAAVDVDFAVETASVDAVQRAAYRFCDRFSCEVIPGDAAHHCRLTPIADVDIAAEVADFRTEVLDQALRERIRAETEPIRTMILAQAFSKTGVVDPQDLG